MTPREYWTACRVHDWTYMYSDDPGVYRAGREDRERLEKMARHNPELEKIFIAWHEHHFNSGAKPDEPKLEETKTQKKEKMSYQITNAMPVPSRKRRPSTYKGKYPFKMMSPGDSFFAPGMKGKTIYMAAYYASKRMGGKTRFKVIELSENGVSGSRVWRVK